MNASLPCSQIPVTPKNRQKSKAVASDQNVSSNKDDYKFARWFCGDFCFSAQDLSDNMQKATDLGLQGAVPFMGEFLTL